MDRKTISTEAALNRLQNLCAKAEYCRYELSQKLYNWGISKEDSDKILDLLADSRYWDEQRYADSYVRDKLRMQHWGRMKIKMGLIGKRVPEDIISQALEQIEQKEYINIAKEVLKAKLRNMPPLSEMEYQDKMSLVKYMASRGFETSLTFKFLKM